MLHCGYITVPFRYTNWCTPFLNMEYEFYIIYINISTMDFIWYLNSDSDLNKVQKTLDMIPSSLYTGWPQSHAPMLHCKTLCYNVNIGA